MVVDDVSPPPHHHCARNVASPVSGQVAMKVLSAGCAISDLNANQVRESCMFECNVCKMCNVCAVC